MDLLNKVVDVFADKLVVDEREPAFTFNFKGEEYGFFNPSLKLWNQCIVILLIQTVIQVTLGATTYLTIVKQREQRPYLAYAIGYLFILPVGVAAPYGLIEWLDLQNVTLKFATGTLGIIAMFRTFEAMYATSPHCVENSIGTYMVYFTSLTHFDWDVKTGTRRQITREEMFRNVKTMVTYMIAFSILLSIALAYDYSPFGEIDGHTITEFSFGLWCFNPRHVANNYFRGMLTNSYVAMAFGLPALSENVRGYATMPSFENPLFSSRSIRQFWGEKWNLTVHRMLKNGTYFPARQFFSKGVASFITFIASGILHDYIWSLQFYTRHLKNAFGECARAPLASCYKPRPLKLTAFFVWMGFALAINENRALCKYFAWVQKLPTWVVSTMIIVGFSGPVSHWFSGDWCVGRNFSDMGTGVWQIRKLAAAEMGMPMEME